MAPRFRNKEKVLAALKRIPAAMKAEVQEQGDKEAAGLAAAVQRAAPATSDLEKHPGELRESVRWSRDDKRELAWRVTVDPKDEHGHGYAKSVEFGHLAKDGAHVAPAPFAYPTKRAMRRGIRSRMAAAGRRGVKKAAPDYVRNL
jgi:hypothetical protein